MHPPNKISGGAYERGHKRGLQHDSQIYEKKFIYSSINAF